jgi:hypothetical protein
MSTHCQEGGMGYFERYRDGERRLAGKSAADRVAALRQLAAAAEREAQKSNAIDAMRAACDLAQGEVLRYPKNAAFQEVLAELQARLEAVKARP